MCLRKETLFTGHRRFVVAAPGVQASRESVSGSCHYQENRVAHSLLLQILLGNLYSSRGREMKTMHAVQAGGLHHSPDMSWGWKGREIFGSYPLPSMEPGVPTGEQAWCSPHPPGYWPRELGNCLRATGRSVRGTVSAPRSYSSVFNTPSPSPPHA